MRLFAAARLSASGIFRKRSSARRRTSMSSSDCVRLASTASNISVVTVRPASPSRYELRKRSTMYVQTLLGDFRLLLHRLRRDRSFDQLPQVEIELPLEDRSQHAERGAAQAERIARAARLLADREDARERVDACRRARARCRCASRGNAVAREARPVLLFERGADFRRARRRAARSTCPSVPAARGIRRPSASADRTCSAQRRGAPASASAPIDSAMRTARRPTRSALSYSEPSFAWNVTLFSIAPTRFEPLAPIAVPEERRVREPRPYDALVAVAHFVRRRGSRYWRRR